MIIWILITSYLLAGVICAYCLSYLARKQLIESGLDPFRFVHWRYLSIEDLVDPVMTCLLWPLILLMTVVSTPKYHRECRYWSSPAGIAKKIQEERGRIQQTLKPWVDSTWIVDWGEEEIDKRLNDNYAEARAFKELVKPGDSICWWMTPGETWSAHTGRGGLLILRNDEVIAQRILIMN